MEPWLWRSEHKARSWMIHVLALARHWHGTSPWARSSLFVSQWTSFSPAEGGSEIRWLLPLTQATAQSPSAILNFSHLGAQGSLTKLSAPWHSCLVESPKRLLKYELNKNLLGWVPGFGNFITPQVNLMRIIQLIPQIPLLSRRVKRGPRGNTCSPFLV